ncbi:MAG: hypothetical protein WA191_07095 [Telluria sp.]
MEKFKSGATVYSADGQAAEYVARIDEGHIVRPMVEAYSGDGESSYEHLCDPVTWRAAFAVPPVAKFNDELRAIHSKIAAATEALAAKRAEDAMFNATAAKRKAARDQVDTLRYVDEFLAGKLTHYAVLSEYQTPHVMLVGDATQGDRPYNKEMRLLCLYGKLDGTRTPYWQLHKYSDSSGSYGDTVVPARSQEEAEGYIRAHIEKCIAIQLKELNYSANTIVAHADAWSVPVPDSLRKLSDDIKAKAKEQEIESARKNYTASADRMRSLGLMPA